MIVLTVKTLETMTPAIQRDIHSILQIEFMTEYIFKDMEDSQYSSTIITEEETKVVNTVQENSVKIPEYTILIDILDMECNKLKEYRIKDGVKIEKEPGSKDFYN